MTEFSHAISRVTGMQPEAELLGPVLIFCATGMALTLLAIAALGIDLTCVSG